MNSPTREPIGQVLASPQLDVPSSAASQDRLCTAIPNGSLDAVGVTWSSVASTLGGDRMAGSLSMVGTLVTGHSIFDRL